MRFRLFTGRNVAPVMPLCPPLSVQQNSGGGTVASAGMDSEHSWHCGAMGFSLRF